MFDLDYLASLHGIASLRGKVDQKQGGSGPQLQVPRAGKQSAVDRKIQVEERGESEEEEDGEALNLFH